MSQVTTELLIGAITIAISIMGSAMSAAFVMGSKWAKLTTEVRYMNDRLAKIEGMFTLRFRGEDPHAD